ncbi:MAG TPA: GNAT family N-acetyltransferase [Paludibaculum sp.]|jgi:GNAT superfamily N-acetyltransferase
MPPTDPGIEIRPPWPSEEPLFRRLLPGTLAGADRLVSAAAGRGDVLAAAAWSYVNDRACGLRIEVRPAHRRQGLGRALAAAAIAACRHRDCASLEAIVPHPGTYLLASLGFRQESALTTVSIDVEAQRDALAAAVRRFALPPGYALRDCHAAALASCRLWQSHDRMVSTLDQIANARQQTARALFRGAQPIAFIYYTRTPGALTFDLWAAAPSARGTRANLALPASLIAPALTDGTAEIRFTWAAGTRHTPSLAARFSARTVMIQDRYLLPLLP